MGRGVALAALAVVLMLPAASAHGEPANGDSFGFGESFGESMTPDGRYVAFDSSAPNLVASDLNGQRDVFVRDRRSAKTERVSVGKQEVEGNERSFDEAISADGRYVAFQSWASNLVPGDKNGKPDVFVRDRMAGTTELVSAGLGGMPGNDWSDSPSISADGRYVAFISLASNLVPDDVAETWNIFVRDRLNGTTEQVDVSSAGVPASFSHRVPMSATINADGRFVAFSTEASNLVDGDTNGTTDAFVRDRTAGTTERVSVGDDGRQLTGDPFVWADAISADGRYVAFSHISPDVVAGDHNGTSDVFLRDRLRRTTERIDVASDGTEANDLSGGANGISPDGRYVDQVTRPPRPPRAGRLYTVAMHVVAGGHPVAVGAVSVAKAIVRGRRIPIVRKSFADSTARVVWRIPKSARNRHVTVTIT